MTSSPKEIQALMETFDFSNQSYQVLFSTSMGDILLNLFPDVAPGHCRNILALAKSGFYTNLVFHRVIEGFVIQGGCPTGNGTGGPGYTVKAEFNSKPHNAGTLSMARAMDPDSAGSQFFLCLGRVTHLDNQYTVFGEAANQASLDVILAIGQVETTAGDRPKTPVVIKSATVVTSPK
jgi:peptidyl-prolyl cis-trans isomerase B (cyclophilin B)